MSSNDHIPVIPYHAGPTARALPQPIAIRREGEELVVTIAPGSATKLILGQMVLFAALLPPTCLFGSIAVLGIAGRLPSDAVFTAGAIGTVGAALLARSVFRFVPVARFGRLPATLTVSRQRLAARVPTLGRRGQREWAGPLVADVAVRHAGLFPALLRFIRIQLTLADDRADVILIPSPGGESLALLEDNLRDALGLPLITA